MSFYYYIGVGALVLIQILVLVLRNKKKETTETPRCCGQAMPRIGIHYAPRCEGMTQYHVESIQLFKCGGCHRVTTVTESVFQHQNKDVANKVMEQLERIVNPQQQS